MPITILCTMLALITTRSFALETNDLKQLHTTPAPSTQVLQNPGMGLYLQYPPMDSQPDEWFMELSDIAYYRLDWSDVNPEPGVYTFDKYFQPMFDKWVTQCNKRVAFRIMCESMHSEKKYVTPKWVFDAGVPGVKHQGIVVTEQIDPAFWNQQYLDLQVEFIKQLGAYLNGREGLEYIDIGSIGEWGEMHLMRWTKDQLDITGYSETAYIEAYRRIIDAFAQAFPDTPVFLNVGGKERLTIMDYAAQKGMHFRQDGLKHDGASYDVGSWLYMDYAPRGVMCNFEFFTGYDGMVESGWSVQESFNKGLEAPISYLNTNLGDYRTLPDDAREMMRDAAMRIGYRMTVTDVAHPRVFSVTGKTPARINMKTTWCNTGIAPCYKSYALEWSVCNEAGEIVHSQLQFPPTPTTRWTPGKEISFYTQLRPAGDLPPGTYTVQVAMIDPENKTHINLNLAQDDGQKRYLLYSIQAEARDDEGLVIFEENFEQGLLDWGTAAVMTAVITQDVAHSGTRSLLLEGTQTGSWNYLSRLVNMAQAAGGMVRLSAWVKVDEVSSENFAPYMKIGVNRTDGSWIENYNTNAYDLSRIGEWQQLVVEPDLSPETADANLCVEKGNDTATVSVKLYLDDVKLEILQLP